MLRRRVSRIKSCPRILYWNHTIPFTLRQQLRQGYGGNRRRRRRTARESLAGGDTVTMRHRARTTAFLVLLVSAVWCLAFLAYDYSSRINAWNTYREVGGPLLATCIVIVLIVSSLLVARSGLLPGRLVASVIIGLFAATYILPVTTMSPTGRKRMYTEDRFLGFQERTVQYLAFCLPVVIGVTISSRRKQSHATVDPPVAGRCARDDT